MENKRLQNKRTCNRIIKY